MINEKISIEKLNQFDEVKNNLPPSSNIINSSSSKILIVHETLQSCPYAISRNQNSTSGKKNLKKSNSVVKKSNSNEKNIFDGMKGSVEEEGEGTFRYSGCIGMECLGVSSRFVGGSHQGNEYLTRGPLS